jgi:ribosomal protein S18 acetylase RimI-like enzyme
MNDTPKIEIRVVKSWRSTDIIQLYKSGGWWKESYDPQGIPSLITGSLFFAVAVDISTDIAVGMGRVISDGVSDAYIQDTVILPEYRSLHLGKQLVQTLVEKCRSKGINWIGLIAEPGTESFYEHLGFRKMKDHVPLLYIETGI